jgi:uncharacterized membrane protein
MFGSDWFWITLAGYALLAPLAALLLGWWALRRGRDLRTELARLRLELRQVGQQTPETDGRAEQVTPAPEEKPVDEPPVPDAGTGELSLSTAPPSPAEKKAAETPAPPEDDRRAVRASPFAPEETRQPGWEQRLASRWLLWLGGIALALGGGFLVKVSIDMGLFGPAVRCIAGAGLGLALIVGGEVLRRRPLQMAIAAQAPNYLPPALSAAGLAMLFASIFAAHGLSSCWARRRSSAWGWLSSRVPSSPHWVCSAVSPRPSSSPRPSRRCCRCSPFCWRSPWLRLPWRDTATGAG